MGNLYAKLMCDALTDPKLLAAGPEGFTLWAKGLLFAKLHMTDGAIPRVMLPMLGVGIRRVEDTARQLVVLGLWVETDEGFSVGSEKWARYQTTRDAIETQRENWRSHKARQRGGHGKMSTVDKVVDKGVDTTVDSTGVSCECPATRAQSTEHRAQILPPKPPSCEGGSRPPGGHGADTGQARAAAERFLAARHAAGGPRVTPESAAAFAEKVFGPMLGEYDRSEVDEVLAFLERPGCRWWRFVNSNPRGYEHSLRRNFPAILAEARQGDRTPHPAIASEAYMEHHDPLEVFEAPDPEELAEQQRELEELGL